MKRGGEADEYWQRNSGPRYDFGKGNGYDGGGRGYDGYDGYDSGSRGYDGGGGGKGYDGGGKGYTGYAAAGGGKGYDGAGKGYGGGGGKGYDGGGKGYDGGGKGYDGCGKGYDGGGKGYDGGGKGYDGCGQGYGGGGKGKGKSKTPDWGKGGGGKGHDLGHRDDRSGRAQAQPSMAAPPAQRSPLVQRGGPGESGRWGGGEAAGGPGDGEDPIVELESLPPEIVIEIDHAPARSPAPVAAALERALLPCALLPVQPVRAVSAVRVVGGPAVLAAEAEAAEEAAEAEAAADAAEAGLAAGQNKPTTTGANQAARLQRGAPARWAEHALAPLHRRAASLHGRLVSLCLTQLPLEGDAALAALAPLTSLRCLRIEGCTPLPTEALRELRGCTRLELVSFRGCTRLTDQAVGFLMPMQALQLLCLDETRCGDVALLMACALGAPLARLHMARCAGVTDKGLQVLGRRSGVTELNLSGCEHVSGETCNPTRRTLQPHAPEAATPRARGCNAPEAATRQRLPPRAHRWATRASAVWRSSAASSGSTCAGRHW